LTLAELRSTGGLNRNRDEILEIESKLNGIEERINKDKVANYLKEDILNNKKTLFETRQNCEYGFA
jgi:hypothetical protein